MKLNVNIRKWEKSKQVRKQWLIPAIVYGKHLKDAVAVTCNKNDFIKRYKEAGYSTPITLNWDGLDQMVLIHDIQLDPVTDILLHVDFLAVQKDEKVSAEVPIVLIGESSVEKLWEWKIQLVKDAVEVEAFPQDLPHDIKVDISAIQKVSDTIFVKDLKVSDKVKINDDLEQVVVTVLSLTEEIEEVPVATVETTTAEWVATDETKEWTDKKEDKKEDKKSGK